jgi:pyruvate carboxylase
MYPDVFLKFARNQQSWGAVEVLPTPCFFYGMTKGQEITLDLEPGKTLVVKFMAIGDPNPDGTRTVFFELNGQPREVRTRDRSLNVRQADRVVADPSQPGQVGAPIPGAVTSVAVEAGQVVKQGDKLLVMEAMKMQTTVVAPISGRVEKVVAKPGQHVEPKDLLLVLAPN